MWPPAEHRRWLIRNALLVTAMINAATTAGIGAVTQRAGGMEVWSWRHTSTVIDGLVTLVTLPFITTLVVTLVIRRSRRAGRIERLRGLALNRPWIAMLPERVVLRAVVAAAATFAVFCIPLTAGLVLAGPMGGTTFLVYKACLAVALGAVVTPPLALRAMAER